MKEFTKIALVDPLEQFIRQVGNLLPHLIAMLFIISIGLLFAYGVKLLVLRLLKVIRFDQFIARVGFTQTMGKGMTSEVPTYIISRIVYWSIVLIFVMLGLGALKLKAVDQFVAITLSFLPNLLVSLLIVTMGLILGNFFGRATLITAVNSQWKHSRLLARGVRLVTIIFALAMAFEQLGIAKSIIVSAFSISFGGIVLALAIAFGLGGKEAARELIQDRLHGSENPPEAKEKDFSHL